MTGNSTGSSESTLYWETVVIHACCGSNYSPRSPKTVMLFGKIYPPWPSLLPVQVGSSLFVHGGVLPAHVEYGLERINK